MSYVPNPSDPTEPVASRTVESAAREFREIKGLLARSLSFPAADTPTNRGLLPRAADRAGRLLVFDPVTGQPVAGPLTPDLVSVVATATARATDATARATEAAASATNAATSATNAAASATAAINAAGLAQATNPSPPIYLNAVQVTANFGIPATHNGHSVGPIQINPGVTVSISPGARWVIA